MPSSPYWKLRRLAPRTIRVIDRRSEESPALSIYKATLPDKARAFMRAYDASANHEAVARKELGEGKLAVAALHRDLLSWVPVLLRDVPGFDASEYVTPGNVPDDVISGAERLLDAVEDAVGKDGKPLSYRLVLLEKLGERLRAAQKEWQEAEAADKREQELQKALRTTGDAFDAELQLFRRSLAVVVGRSDRDYQRLRAARASEPDDDDDSDAPPAPEAVEPGEPPRG